MPVQLPLESRIESCEKLPTHASRHLPGIADQVRSIAYSEMADTQLSVFQSCPSESKQHERSGICSFVLHALDETNVLQSDRACQDRAPVCRRRDPVVALKRPSFVTQIDFTNAVFETPAKEPLYGSQSHAPQRAASAKTRTQKGVAQASSVVQQRQAALRPTCGLGTNIPKQPSLQDMANAMSDLEGTLSGGADRTSRDKLYQRNRAVSSERNDRPRGQEQEQKNKQAAGQRRDERAASRAERKKGSESQREQDWEVHKSSHNDRDER